jgi:hypothetical protein
MTIVYDNEVKKDGLKAGWGFSCFIQTENVPSAGKVENWNGLGYRKYWVCRQTYS